jgi:Bacterial Ig-like domain
MQLHHMLFIAVALGLAACQTTPVVKTPITTVAPDPVNTTPKPEPKPIAIDETPGSNPAVSTSLSILTTQSEQPGEPLPLIGVNAEWVAFQDGNGPWRVLEGSAGVYPFTVTNKAGKYGIAYICPKAPGGSVLVPPLTAPTLEMRLFTLAEIKAPRFGCNVPYQNPNQISPTTKTFRFSGDIKGLEATEFATIQTQNGSVFSDTSSIDPTNSYRRVLRQGTYSVIVGRRKKSASGYTDFTTPYNKVIVEQDFNLNADTVRDFDFSTQGFSPVQKTVKVVGVLKSEQLYLSGFTSYGTALVDLPNLKNYSADTAIGTLDVIPENLLGSDDVYAVRAYTNSSQGQDRTGRDIYKTGKTWPSSLTLPAVPVIQFRSETETTYARPNVKIDQIISSGDLIQLQFSEDAYTTTGQTTGRHVWNIAASGNWLNAAQTLIAPDFSGLSGWKSDWGFKKIADMGWFVSITRYDMPFQHVLAANDPIFQREATQAETLQLYKTINFSGSSLIHPTADKLRPEIVSAVPFYESPTAPVSTNIPLAYTKNFRIGFSEMMSKTSVIAAYQSDTLPADAVTLTWPPYTGDTVFDITPKALLEVGKTYSFTIGAAAQDLAGNSLVAKTFTFTVTN